MGGTVLKWGLPALVTVVGGTLAAVAVAGPSIPATLADRAHVLLRDGKVNWASVSFDMQDAVVAGQAPSTAAAEKLLADLSAIPGIRSVSSAMTIAVPVAPGPFVATVAGGAITLSGSVPDEAARALLVAEAGDKAVDRLEIRGPVADRDTWMRGADFTLAQAERLTEGEVALTDGTLTLSGRARSPDDLASLTRLAEAAPAGVKTGFTEVSPPVQSPYSFTASFDGKRLVLKGFVPDAKLVDALEALAPAGVSVEAELTPAAGAPDGFADNAAVLVRNLLTLKSGEAAITDAKQTLDGTAADAARADALTAELARRNVSGTIASETAAILNLSLEKAGGRLTIAGDVGDKSTESRLAALPSASLGAITVKPRAPENFGAAVEVALKLAEHLSEGEVTIRGTTVTAAGRVTAEADLAAARALKLPAGFTLTTDKLKLPLAATYIFKAEKTADGLVLSGLAPDDATRQALLSSAKSGALSLADGAPTGFAADAAAGLKLLDDLETGTLAFDGKAWLLSGKAATAEAGEALRTAFAASPLAASAKLDVAAPAPVIATISPYSFTAERTADGVLLTGYVPDDATRQSLLAGLAGKVVDRTQLGAGAPPDFAAAAKAAIATVASLDKGSAGLRGSDWTIAGTVATGAEKQALEASLAGVATPRWSIAIQAADAPPLVSPFLWSAEKSETGAITLAGYVPDATLRQSLARLAGSNATDNTLVGSGEPRDFAKSAEAGLTALVALRSGKLAFDGSTWSLTGQPADGAAFDTARAAVASLGSGIAVTLSPPPAAQPEKPAAATETDTASPGATTDATSAEASTPADQSPAPTEPAATTDTAKAAAPEQPAADTAAPQQLAAVEPGAVKSAPAAPVTPPLENCQATVGRLAARNAIVFASGKAVLLKESTEALDELATDLVACPKVIVNVEGHTDSDGDADANLALSVARAEAVVDQLIARGISADRLYAVGYGESLPIASNDTKAGKQANRRIAFTLAESQ